MYFVFFFKQKTAYELRSSDCSSDVCSADLLDLQQGRGHDAPPPPGLTGFGNRCSRSVIHTHGSISAPRNSTKPCATSPRIWPDVMPIGRASCRESVGQHV